VVGGIVRVPAELAATAARPPGLVVGKLKDLHAPNAITTDEYILGWPNRGSPQANWHENAGLLREAIDAGRPIRDASVNPVTGALRDETGFLRAERYLLADRGWKYDAATRLWYPPAAK
jgi:hypothetical protein